MRKVLLYVAVSSTNVIARELGQDFDEKGMVSSIALRGKGKVVRVWVFLTSEAPPLFQLNS